VIKSALVCQWSKDYEVEFEAIFRMFPHVYMHIVSIHFAVEMRQPKVASDVFHVLYCGEQT
jgi:hypothetical protein